jgi:hypothetical protein
MDAHANTPDPEGELLADDAKTAGCRPVVYQSVLWCCLAYLPVVPRGVCFLCSRWLVLQHHFARSATTGCVTALLATAGLVVVGQVGCFGASPPQPAYVGKGTPATPLILPSSLRPLDHLPCSPCTTSRRLLVY